MRWGKVDSISFFKVILKAKSIICLFSILFFNSVCGIVYFLTIPYPSYSMFIIIFFWKNKRLNSITKHWLIFGKVYNIGFDSVVRLSVVYFEVEPLSMSFRVDIILEDKVISLDRIVLLWLLRLAVGVQQISTFKVGIKSDGIWRFYAFFII